MTGWRSIAATAGVALVVSLGATAGTLFVARPGGTQSGCASSGPRLSVPGSGSAQGTPDVLTLSLTVAVTKPSAAAALQGANVNATAVDLALSGNQIAKADIQTTNLTIQPAYSYPGGTQKLTGYTATDSMSVLVKSMSTAGTIIDAVSAAGGNSLQIGALAFSFGNPSFLEAAARSSAVSQARSNALAMASAGKVHLGTLCTITDTTPSQSPQYSYFQSAGLAAGASVVAPFPVSPGNETVTATVNLLYATTPA